MSLTSLPSPPQLPLPSLRPATAPAPRSRRTAAAPRLRPACLRTGRRRRGARPGPSRRLGPMPAPVPPSGAAPPARARPPARVTGGTPGCARGSFRPAVSGHRSERELHSDSGCSTQSPLRECRLDLTSCLVKDNDQFFTLPGDREPEKCEHTPLFE